MSHILWNQQRTSFDETLCISLLTGLSLTDKRPKSRPNPVKRFLNEENGHLDSRKVKWACNRLIKGLFVMIETIFKVNEISNPRVENL